MLTGIFWILFLASSIQYSKSQLIKKKSYLSWANMDYTKLNQMIKDVVMELPLNTVALGLDRNIATDFDTNLTKTLHSAGAKTSYYRISLEKDIKQVKWDIKLWLNRYANANYLIFSRQHIMEETLKMIKEDNLIHRNIIYVFLWVKVSVSHQFLSNLHETIRIIVITNPRAGFYQIYYTQAMPKSRGQLKLVNWWSAENGLFRYPLLPSAVTVYKSFHGRKFMIPVLHKPPWNFVNYHNDTTIEVEGGRDDKLFSLLANKLNFKYQYIDPPDRSQGSSVVNGTMQGVLGLVFNKVVDLFIGDLTVTYERSQGVEFSFLTLVDSELFVTHEPERLNEALALIRPFHWIVWPALLLTLLISGPVLYLFTSAAYTKSKKTIVKHESFGDCIWITCTIFLQQAVIIRSKDQNVRFIIVLLSLAVTYVIGDMYSANLTSLFARPTKEPPINMLNELMTAMEKEHYQLLVEENSASHSNLENGTDIYKAIWKLMVQQNKYFIESTEEGMKLVRDRKKYAIIGGRETFYYDTSRFGAQNFHLSEKLNTRYSAIALQIGCPYLENFNTILMKLFEGGIYSKITEEEYQKLRQKQIGTVEKATVVSEGAVKAGEDKHLMAMSMKTLQGAFYILIIGYILATLVFFEELYLKKKQIKIRHKRINNWKAISSLTKIIYKIAETSRLDKEGSK